MNLSTISVGQNINYKKSFPDFGELALRPFILQNDIETIHAWVNQDYAKYWGMLGYSITELEASYSKIIQHSHVYMGLFNTKQAFLLECYNPAEDSISKHYQAKPGDCGMHILMAPADSPIPNFTWNVFTLIMDFMFSHETIKRIVVEPDIRNEKIHVLNKRAGFEYQKLIELPHKKAHLAFCTRTNYAMALERHNSPIHFKR